MSETISSYDYTEIQQVVAEHIAQLAAVRKALIETIPPYENNAYALLVEL
jgi:hypothetical protein